MVQRKSIQRSDVSSGLLHLSPTPTHPTANVDGVLTAVIRPSANRSGKGTVEADFHEVVDGGLDPRPAECHRYRSRDPDAAALRMQECANARLRFHSSTAGRKRGELQLATVSPWASDCRASNRIHMSSLRPLSHQMVRTRRLGTERIKVHELAAPARSGLLYLASAGGLASAP